MIRELEVKFMKEPYCMDKKIQSLKFAFLKIYKAKSYQNFVKRMTY